MNKIMLLSIFSCGLLIIFTFIWTYGADLIQIFYIKQSYLLIALILYSVLLLLFNLPTPKKVVASVENFKHRSNEKFDKFSLIMKNPQVRIGLIFITIVLFFTIFAGQLTQYDPMVRRTAEWNSQTRTFRMFDNLKPCAEHWFGTTPLGEDVFSQVMYGLQNTIKMAVMASVFSLILGTVLGLISGYYQIWVTNGIDYFVNMVLVLPILFLILLLKTTIKIDFLSTVMIISIFGMAKTARLIKGEIMVLRKKEFVVAAQAIGSQEIRILFNHLLPILYPILVTQFMTLIGSNIAIESSLSFLKFHTELSLGTLIHNSFFMSLVKGNWWYFAFPALFLALSIIGFSFFGEGLRQVIYQPVIEEEITHG